MTLKIGSSLTGGLRRIANRNGLIIACAYIVLGLVWQLTFYSAVASWVQHSGVSPQEMALPHIDGPFVVMAVGAVLSLLLLQYLTVVAIRVFVGNQADSIPSDYYTRHVVGAVINSILGSIAYGLLVTIGSILLLIPGIIAYVAFIFMMIYIAVEDENLIAALRDSWTLTRGHWLRLFALLVVVFVVVGIVFGLLSLIVTFAISAAAGPSISTLVTGVLALPFSMFSLGVLAEAFTQLRNGQPLRQD